MIIRKSYKIWNIVSCTDFATEIQPVPAGSDSQEQSEPCGRFLFEKRHETSM